MIALLAAAAAAAAVAAWADMSLVSSTDVQ